MKICQTAQLKKHATDSSSPGESVFVHFASRAAIEIILNDMDHPSNGPSTGTGEYIASIVSKSFALVNYFQSKRNELLSTW